jgi:hypothetical protein
MNLPYCSDLPTGAYQYAHPYLANAFHHILRELMVFEQVR